MEDIEQTSGSKRWSILAVPKDDIPKPEKNHQDLTKEKLIERRAFATRVTERNLSPRSAIHAKLYEIAIQQALEACDNQRDSTLSVVYHNDRFHVRHKEIFHIPTKAIIEYSVKLLRLTRWSIWARYSGYLGIKHADIRKSPSTVADPTNANFLDDFVTGVYIRMGTVAEHAQDIADEAFDSERYQTRRTTEYAAEHLGTTTPPASQMHHRRVREGWSLVHPFKDDARRLKPAEPDEESFYKPLVEGIRDAFFDVNEKRPRNYEEWFPKPEIRERQRHPHDLESFADFKEVVKRQVRNKIVEGEKERGMVKEIYESM